MRRHILILFLPFLFIGLSEAQDSLRFSGQLSSWLNWNSANYFPLWAGLRYIPQINYEVTTNPGLHFDAEASANIFGNAGLKPFDTISASGKIKPYRAWIRLYSEQFELRFGLQKINFGSASILRPLMWFDQIDPRDPLQLTDGVWGVLARYYFLNNTNIWLWGLYGNNESRGWETVPVNSKIPEFGGRVQLPIPSGEVALSYHHRVADSRDIGSGVPSLEKIPENRIGFDIKWDMKAGFWIEGSLTHKGKDLGLLSNQVILNAGIDYTFGMGNGIYCAYEQLLATYGNTLLSFDKTTSFSLVSTNYPFGMFDRLGAIVFYNWDAHKIYTFLSWQRQFDKIMFYLMAYWNPESYQLPTMDPSDNIFAGKGIQLMFVFNH
ncbi:MAG TPA: hypothetical protein PK719_04300 [Bacteroidales bacterium]|jgi:hypothetical protein|nr:hypothetical protein [Bacteroidales bacterium]OQB57747.1 MAG: hypothetical protein BWX96_03123 [Bacteroidetes bacterium ADurb.Bin145]HOU02307.1 hypothetical protein [Bacteroidales bacterium]HQG62853.1 hypothetical protein [Bacteroidales bacterium]HQK68312.1 hypothetical protein [Bacteroidales bacterium]